VTVLVGRVRGARRAWGKQSAAGVVSKQPAAGQGRAGQGMVWCGVAWASMALAQVQVQVQVRCRRESAQARGYRRAAGRQAGRNVSRKRVESKKRSECGVCMGEEGDMRDMDLQSDAQLRCSQLRSRDAGMVVGGWWLVVGGEGARAGRREARMAGRPAESSRVESSHGVVGETTG
jgi:hypothetical protein